MWTMTTFGAQKKWLISWNCKIMAPKGVFDQKFGPFNFFDQDFGPLVKKVGHPCSRYSIPDYCDSVTRQAVDCGSTKLPTTICNHKATLEHSMKRNKGSSLFGSVLSLWLYSVHTGNSIVKVLRVLKGVGKHSCFLVKWRQGLLFFNIYIQFFAFWVLT